jgi:hypothetical protein
MWRINTKNCGNDEWENDGREEIWNTEAFTREKRISKRNTEVRGKFEIFITIKFQVTWNNKAISNWER